MNAEAENAVRELVERSRAGDVAAFDRLSELYRERLEASVKARLARHGARGIEAREVVQETFVRALQAIERFEWREADSFYRWLSGISRRVALVIARQSHPHQCLDLANEIPSGGPSASRSLAREERYRRLQDAIRDLSTDHREVILLARIEGLTIKEIAARMDRSPAAVKQLLFRALKQLRKVFGDTQSLGLPDRRLNLDETNGNGNGKGIR